MKDKNKNYLYSGKNILSDEDKIYLENEAYRIRRRAYFHLMIFPIYPFSIIYFLKDLKLSRKLVLACRLGYTDKFVLVENDSVLKSLEIIPVFNLLFKKNGKFRNDWKTIDMDLLPPIIHNDYSVPISFGNEGADNNEDYRQRHLNQSECEELKQHLKLANIINTLGIPVFLMLITLKFFFYSYWIMVVAILLNLIFIYFLIKGIVMFIGIKRDLKFGILILSDIDIDKLTIDINGYADGDSIPTKVRVEILASSGFYWSINGRPSSWRRFLQK